MDKIVVDDLFDDLVNYPCSQFVGYAAKKVIESEARLTKVEGWHWFTTPVLVRAGQRA